VLDELVGPADALDRRRAVAFLQGLQDRASESARQDVVLKGDNEGDQRGLAQEEGAVQRADEAGVDDPDRDVLLGLEPVRDR
jgi:hypothetical protein